MGNKVEEHEDTKAKLKQATDKNNVPININNTRTDELRRWVYGLYDNFFGSEQRNTKQINAHLLRGFKRLWDLIQLPTSSDDAKWYKPQTANSFVKGILAIVLTMLVSTKLILMYVMVTPAVKKFLEVGGWAILIPALILLCAVYCGVVCSSCGKSSCRFIFLYFEVIAVSVILAQIASAYRTNIIYYAVIATAMVVLVCLLLGCYNFDFTSGLLYVVVVSTAVIAILLIALVLLAIDCPIESAPFVILTIITLVYVVMLALQLQNILKGKSVKMNDTDYSLGAFLLYIAVINILFRLISKAAARLSRED